MEKLRAQTFRKLKPPCVSVSQGAVKYKANKVTSHEYIKILQTLLDTLQGEGVFLDSRLADYVFFPLSHVFREAKEVPIKVLETALGCLRILIQKGWRDSISLEMSKQLIVLLCFLVGGDTAQSKVKDIKEELGIAAYKTLATIAQVCQNLGLSIRGCFEDRALPTLGHVISLMIDGFTEGPSVNVRLAAISALKQTLKSITDHNAVKNFFPGIVSSLAKLLAAKGMSKPPLKILVAGLETLEIILPAVLSDRDASLGDKCESEPHGEGGYKWLEATSYQVKMALANVVPLRYHESLEVKTALAQLCIVVTTCCRSSLSTSTRMLIETLVVLSVDTSYNAVIKTSFVRLLQADPPLVEVLKTAFHDWTQALPRTIQAKDDTRRQRLIDQVATACSLLHSLDTNIGLMSESFATHLQASITVAVQESSKQIVQITSGYASDIAQSLQIARKASVSSEFAPVLFGESGMQTTLKGLVQLVGQLQFVAPSENFEQSILTPLRSTTSNEQLASLWLALQLLSREVSDLALVNEYLDARAVQRRPSMLLDEVYSFALSVLSRSAFDFNDSTWCLQALSLEALALQAQAQGQDFRPESVEALYPILERLGSNNALLQEHAMTCLNIVSKACAYPSSAALIIDNADYLVNAISLKLNTFDISPQAPQVLVMMIRLCGAPLILFLDDLVDSIFSILACYHGYPKLVESLFTVLYAIVEESSKSNETLIEEKRDTTTRPEPYKRMTMIDLADFLRSRREKKDDRPPSPLPDSPSPPSSPESKPSTSPLNPDEESSDLHTLPPAEPPAPKPSKVNTIITSITSLTPSYLTSPSPTLRTSLLNLLSTSFPQLAHDTDAFLPIAAQLYPYMATRLFTPNSHAFEIVAAAKAMSVLCHCAGDFLRSRTDEDWSRLEKLFARVEGEMMEEVRAQRGRTGGMWWRAWDGVMDLAVKLVRDVGVNEEEGAEDWLFETLGVYVGGVVRAQNGTGVTEGGKGLKGKQVPKTVFRCSDVMGPERREELREALEGLNPDYLWLVQERGRVQRGGERLKKPDDVGGVQFHELDY